MSKYSGTVRGRTRSRGYIRKERGYFYLVVMSEYTELREFSLDTNNLPLINTGKLRRRFNRWRHKGYDRLPTIEDGGLEGELEEVIFDRTTALNAEVNETGFSSLGNIPVDGVGGGLVTGFTATGLGYLPIAGIGLAAGGVAIKAVSDAVKDKTLPGTEYVGPGNEIKIDAPKISSDVVAKEHDIEYERLINAEISNKQFQEGIMAADKLAIDKFREDYNTYGNWQSKVGQFGLQIKHGVETVYGGVVYPNRKFYLF